MPSYVLTNPRGESVTVTSLPEFNAYRRRNYTLASGSDSDAVAAFGGQGGSGALVPAAYVSRYASAATAAATASLLGKLKRGVQDAVMLYIGDSTGNETTEHVYLELVDLAARFPAYTVLYRPYNDAGGSYDAAATIQTGTSARTLTVYNCSIAGASPGYVLGTRWSPAVATVPEPDLVLISHGHNMGDPSANNNGQRSMTWNFLGLTEEVALQFPRAGIVLESQNPTTLTGRETWQAIKAQVMQELAARRGFGFIDVHQAFVDYGNFASLLSDGVHPTPAGSRLWADVVGAAFTYDPAAAVRTALPPSLSQIGKSLIPDPEFRDWSGTDPAGWTMTNATSAKDTTNFETGAHGFQIIAGGTTGAAQAVYAGNPATLGIKGRLDGKLVTVAARVYVPASYTGTPSLVVKDNAGSSQQSRSDVLSTTRDRYHWLIATKRVAVNPTAFEINLATRLSGSQAGSITVDRLYVVEGDLPRTALP